jgi:hypothetical protein
MPCSRLFGRLDKSWVETDIVCNELVSDDNAIVYSPLAYTVTLVVIHGQCRPSDACRSAEYVNSERVNVIHPAHIQQCPFI